MPNKKDTSGECVWEDNCPVCLGSGKIETHNRRTKTIDSPTKCECCNGTGKIFVVKKLRRREK